MIIRARLDKSMSVVFFLLYSDPHSNENTQINYFVSHSAMQSSEVLSMLRTGFVGHHMPNCNRRNTTMSQFAHDAYVDSPTFAPKKPPSSAGTRRHRQGRLAATCQP